MDQIDPSQYAAVDLGSNSFHLVVARVEQGQLRVVDRLRESVQLGLGMGDDKRIAPAARERGLACLANFGQRLRTVPPEQRRVVGTNTLRRAADGADFVAAAEPLLGQRIEIISGREEARLIYEGVLHHARSPELPRLVIDIGGGSTELIVGAGGEPTLVESISAGCVVATDRHFGKGAITAEAMAAAIESTQIELHTVLQAYRAAHWTRVTGCSGTIKALTALAEHLGHGNGDKLSREAMVAIVDWLVERGHIDKLSAPGLNARRRAVIAGGAAVLQALFQSLDIEVLSLSSAALREGVLMDLVGERHHKDVQVRTVSRLQNQFSLDAEQAERVAQTALALADSAETLCPLEPAGRELLGIAARLHEIGWAVAHSQYHKHGQYLIANADLAGFSRTEQHRLAALVRYQRRKLPNPIETIFADEAALWCCRVLRLAVLLNRDRQRSDAVPLRFGTNPTGLQLCLPEAWLADNPLYTAELKQECQEWRRVGRPTGLVSLGG